jgi:uncharacterized membrane-anchored protein
MMMAAALITGAVTGPALQAQAAPTTQTDARKTELKAAWADALKAGQAGPARITLQDQGAIDLPAGQIFVPARQANRLMVALGNRELAGRSGLIIPVNGRQSWLIDVEWVKEGYVKDGDAKEWQPDAMLDSLKEGTQEDNKRREREGAPQLDVIGWVEKPTYDPATHHLIWSLALQDKGAPANAVQTINYNTYALGREGYFSLDLITGSDTIAQDKGQVKSVLDHLAYNEGKRYENFNASTDKVAAYGLAGLIGVVAIKKLGLLAGLGVFLLKVWKIVMVTVLGGWAALRRRIAGLFGRKEEAAPQEVTPVHPAEAEEPPTSNHDEADEATDTPSHPHGA